MYSGYVDYEGLRLSAFSDARLYRLQQKVAKQYVVTKRAYKAAHDLLLVSESTQDASTLEALDQRLQGLRILYDAIRAKCFVEATVVTFHGQIEAAQAKARFERAKEQLRLAESVGLGEDDADLGPELQARRDKVAYAKRVYEKADATATYDAILRRQVKAARALVTAAERLTDLVADKAEDQAVLASAEEACMAARALWRQREKASSDACSFIEDSFEASAHDSTLASSFDASARGSTMASSFEVVGRPASVSTTASASFVQVAASGSRLYEPELSGSPISASPRNSLAATARPSSSAHGSGSRVGSAAAASTSGLANFFDFTPEVASTPLPALNTMGPIGDVPCAARGLEFGEGTAAASARLSSVPSATGSVNQAGRASANVDASFRAVAQQYEHMPLEQASRTVRKKRGERQSRTLHVSRLAKEVTAARVRQLFDQLGYRRIEKVVMGFGDMPFGKKRETQYYAWVTFADLDQAVDCRYRWDGRSDWGLTPPGWRELHMSFCNNDKRTDDLVDHGNFGGSGSDED